MELNACSTGAQWLPDQRPPVGTSEGDVVFCLGSEGKVASRLSTVSPETGSALARTCTALCYLYLVQLVCKTSACDPGFTLGSGASGVATNGAPGCVCNRGQLEAKSGSCTEVL